MNNQNPLKNTNILNYTPTNWKKELYQSSKQNILSLNDDVCISFMKHLGLSFPNDGLVCGTNMMEQRYLCNTHYILLIHWHGFENECDNGYSLMLYPKATMNEMEFLSVYDEAYQAAFGKCKKTGLMIV